MSIALLLRLAGAVAILVSAGASLYAQVLYFRRPGAQWLGFGFGRYYYGEMRREHPRVFLASFGGIALGFALYVLAGLVS